MKWCVGQRDLLCWIVKYYYSKTEFVALGLIKTKPDDRKCVSKVVEKMKAEKLHYKINGVDINK